MSVDSEEEQNSEVAQQRVMSYGGSRPAASKAKVKKDIFS